MLNCPRGRGVIIVAITFDFSSKTDGVMAKQVKKTNKGPYIKNAHLIGKGGGQVKPINGSYVKGTEKPRPTSPDPGTHIQKPIKVQPARKKPDPDSTPRREKSPGRGQKAVKPSVPAKSKSGKSPGFPKTTQVKPVRTVAKKAPEKAAVSKVQSTLKQQAAPKKDTPRKVKQAPVRRR